LEDNMEEKGIETIDEYIAGYPSEIQDILKELRSFIKKYAPEATEKISWSMPTFYLQGNLVHFAVNKGYIGLYPGESGVSVFKDELTGYKTTKGSKGKKNEIKRPIYHPGGSIERIGDRQR